MQLTIKNRKAFVRDFALCGKFALNNKNRPLYSNIKLDASSHCCLSATDLEANICVALDYVDVKQPGICLVLQTILTPIKNSKSESFTLVADDNTVTVLIDATESRFPLADLSDYGLAALTHEDCQCYELPAAKLETIIGRTAFATDLESNRYALGGVLFELSGEKLDAVATDGRRMSHHTAAVNPVGEHKEEKKPIIPTRVLTKVADAFAGQVTISANCTTVILHDEKTTVCTKVIDGRYPRWQDVVNGDRGKDQKTKISLTAGALLNMLKQIIPAKKDSDNKGVKFEFKPGMLWMTKKDAYGRESKAVTTIQYDGEPVACTLDAYYVMDAMKALDKKQSVTFTMIDEDSQVEFHIDDEFHYIVMPLSAD